MKKFLSKKNVVVSIAMLTAMFTISMDILNDNGRAGRTGSPGETTCNTSGCHAGNALNAAGGSITIDCPTMTNWKYVPGQTYQVNVTVERSGLSLFGLGFEALTAAGANAGTFTITNATQTTTKSTTVSGNSRTSVVHKLNGGASSNTHTFTFNWNAPTTDIGTITFYAAGNAANANGSETGDFIYTASRAVTSPTTGFLDVKADQQVIILFPNPASEKLNLNYTLKTLANVSVKLVSLTGQTIYTNFFENQFAGNHHLKIDLNSDMVKGIYFLQLEINNESFTQKVIIE